MTPLLPSDTEQLINLASAASVPLHASGEQSSFPEPEKHQDVSGTPLSDILQVTITTIIATGLTLGLRRIPAGFYVKVQADDIQWQTTNKSVHVGLDVLEWDQHIVLPSEASCKIWFSVYASYEFCPMFGHGDLLRTFEISVAELLDRSKNSSPVVFQPEAGEVISPCTSLLMKMEQSLPCETSVNIIHPIPLSLPHDIHELQLLTDAGHCILRRYRRTQDITDLAQSLVHFERSLDHCPVDHPCRPAALVNLAIVKLIRCQIHATYLDLDPDLDPDVPISLFQGALELRPTGHPDRPATQLHLAIALLFRSTKRGFHTDAEVAVGLLNEVPHNCHARNYLYMSAMAIKGTPNVHQPSDTDTDDLRVDKPISSMLPLRMIQLRCRQVLDRKKRNLPSANGLARRVTWCEQTDDPHALDDVISLHYEALKYHNTTHSDRELLLNNLGCAVHIRFRRRGSDRDLDEAIMLHRETLTLFPAGHPDRPSSLNNLASVLRERFKCRGRDKDLDEAVMLYREALTLHPVGHPDRPMSLSNLATTLHELFTHQGSDKYLDEAVVLNREALTLCPIGHLDRPKSLNNFAGTLHVRFEHRGSDKDLDEAIVLNREALTLRPVGHPDRHTSLNNLASTLRVCFEHRGSDKDLDEAIVLHRETLTLHPVGHPDRPMSLNNLASTLGKCFKHRGSDKDLNEAIVLHREALTLHPIDHPSRPMTFNYLAMSLYERFRHLGSQKDLDDAQANAHSALTLLKSHAPRFALVNEVLATIYLSLHRSGPKSIANDTNDLNAAMYHFKVAADSVSSSLLNRLRTSIQWAVVADQYAHNTLLEAYTTSIQLLDAYMSATASVSSRHHAMKLFPPAFAVNPASIALQNGEVCRAVELLEQGRTLIWTQMARFRAPLDTFKEHDSHTEALVKRFRGLSSILNEYMPPGEGTPRVKEEAEAVRYSRLLDEWNSVVEEIRKVDGFSRFMLPPLFSDLQDAARDGPVIVLIASKLSCDAIIIAHQQSPVCVRLGTSLEKLERLATALQTTVMREREKEANHGEKQMKLVEVLRELWVDIVGPVVEDLAELAQPGSRIWWCPTLLFNFLPLHAAGEYRRGGMNLSSLYVSSYTPSLTALIRARRHHHRSQPSLFAAIGQNHPPGYTFPLESIEPELDLVHDLLPPSPTVCKFTKVTSIESTKSRVFRELQDNHWLHFACHGTQHLGEPFKSAFLMRDEPLTLLDIMQTDMSKHQYAFLSACDTAVGAFDRPDEVIHLAAALQFAGVKSVIGTFWSVDDDTVGRLVKEFYTNFCGDGKMHSKRAARALHKAVQSLANDKNVPLDQRILFMHIGI